MAIYEMKCEKCGHTDEHMRSIVDGPPKSCPKCKSKKYRQVYHAPWPAVYYSPMHPRHRRGQKKW